jgi:hypothetical protein
MSTRDDQLAHLKSNIQQHVPADQRSQTNWIQWLTDLRSLVIPDSLIPNACLHPLRKKKRQLLETVESFYRGSEEVELKDVFVQALELYKNYLKLLETLRNCHEERLLGADFTLLPAMEETYRIRVAEISQLEEKVSNTRWTDWSSLGLDEQDLMLTQEVIQEKINVESGTAISSDPAAQELQRELERLLEQVPPKPEKTTEEYNQWREGYLVRDKNASEDDKSYWTQQRKAILEYQKWLKEKQRVKRELDDLAAGDTNCQRTGVSVYWEKILAHWSEFQEKERLLKQLKMLRASNQQLWTEIVYQRWSLRQQNELTSDKIGIERNITQIERQKKMLKAIVTNWSQNRAEPHTGETSNSNDKKIVTPEDKTNDEDKRLPSTVSDDAKQFITIEKPPTLETDQKNTNIEIVSQSTEGDSKDGSPQSNQGKAMCEQINKRGGNCGNKVKTGEKYCSVHLKR